MDDLTDAQLGLLKQVGAFDAIFREPRGAGGHAGGLPPRMDDFFALISRGSNLEVSGAADYGEWLESDRGQMLVNHNPRALDGANFDDVMNAWIVLNRAGHWAWEDEDYAESYQAGVFEALTGRASEIVRDHESDDAHDA